MLVRMKELLEMAEHDKKAIGMFNTTGLDSIQAVIGAAEELGVFFCKQYTLHFQFSHPVCRTLRREVAKIFSLCLRVSAF